MTKAIKTFLERNRNSKTKMLFVGDAMLDVYYPSSITRISPESPTPVIKSEERLAIKKPGGVANAAYQLTNFNVESEVICFLDHDLLEVMERHDLKTYQLFGKTIPHKVRYLVGGQIVSRVDFEEEQYGLKWGELQGHRYEAIRLMTMSQPDVVVFSDYAKGFFDKHTEYPFKFRNSSQNTISVVDPKYGPLSQWRGCDIFKPNAKEALELTGLSYWKDQCNYFRLHGIGRKAIVITHGGDGVYGLWDDDYVEYHSDRKVAVKSVVGAGDSFASALGLAAHLGLTHEDAIEVAYAFGACYVQHGMNRPIYPYELSDGIVEPEELVERDFKLAFTNGCFDILHSGHIQSLEYAASKADRLVVALNSDESVRRLKGPTRPIKPLAERMKVMASLKMVDYVVSFDEDTPYEVLKKICPDVLVKGSQYKVDDIVGADIVPEVLQAPMVEGMSTTFLLDHLQVQSTQSQEVLQVPEQQHFESTEQ